MKLWTQAVVILAAVPVAVAGWAAFVPASRPYLARAGLLAPIERLGIAGGRNDAAAPGAQGARGPAGGPVTVAAAAVAERTMTDRITSIGTARGVRSATLATEISGRIAALRVASGDYVEAGAVLAELDSKAAAIAVDRAGLVLANEQSNLDRVTRLKATGSATDLQLQEAELAFKSAELGLREAEFELARHTLRAPISGWVGILSAEPGDLVSPGTPIAAIEDRSTLLVDFRVPERVARIVKRGDRIGASSLAEPDLVLDGTILAVDNRLDEASRSLRVQAAIANDGDRMRPGMAIALALDLEGDRFPAVDPLAIQWAREGAYVWILREGRADRLPIRIVQRNADAVLIAARFQPGDLVVTEGMTALRPGVEAAAAPPGSGAAADPSPSRSSG